MPDIISVAQWRLWWRDNGGPRITPIPFTPFLDDMQLQFIDDDIRDHTSLDAKVYTACESNRDNAPPPAVLILLEVVSTAPDQLDQNYQHNIAAKQIIGQYSQNPDEDEDSNLKKLLGWCWREGTFSRIRRLSERSSMTLFFSAISRRTTEILRPAQIPWKELDQYT